MRYSANENAIRNALSQSLSFPAPLDKGNEGSGNEIGKTREHLLFTAHQEILIQYVENNLTII